MRILLPSIALWMFGGFQILAAAGSIVLFNGTSSAGKSSLAEAVVNQGKTSFEVVSLDDFMRSFRQRQALKGDPTPARRIPFNERFLALYRHVRALSDGGTNVLIDTVEFDADYDTYCGILGCSNVTKVVVYCPLQDLLRRIDRRNKSGDPDGRRPLLLSFQQFLQMYRGQAGPGDLVVDRTNTRVMREALQEVGRRVENRARFDALYEEYVRVFGLDQDRDIVLVARGKYDLVLDTRASTKKENVRTLEEHMAKRGR